MQYRALSLLALSATTALAAYEGNLNYRSPSLSHPDLGISVPKVVKRSNPAASFDPSQLNFTHGVASGDPYANSVILWTRCSPTLDDVKDDSVVKGSSPLYNPVPIHRSGGEYTPISQAPVCVEYKVGKDKALKQVVNKGKVYTGSDVDYTVKVEATGLKPFTTYYYQFSVCNSDKKSPIGRTKTLPGASQMVDEVKLAVYSCNNYPSGFFNAYGNVARKDSVDYIIHLGDYIYEFPDGLYGSGKAIGRVPQPDRTVYTLYDYRKRIATHRTDLDLLVNHQNFPWISTWDDHEVGDNTYRDGSSWLSNIEASFTVSGGVSVDQRKMNAVRAYFEWMPIRQVDMDDNLRIWRDFKIGSLVDLLVLDTRHYDRSITDLYFNNLYIKKLKNDASRTLMGSRQENWFYRKLVNSSQRGAKWRLVGSQIIFSHINQATGILEDYNLDAWDGYQANRNRTFETLYENNIKNTIMIAGDSHANWVSDVAWLGQKEYDPKSGKGAIGVEFAGTAVTSPGPLGANGKIPDSVKKSKKLVEKNSVLQWSEMYYRGYFELRITPQKVQTEFFGTPKIRQRDFTEVSLANFTVKDGANRLDRGTVGVPGGGVVENGWVKGGKTVRTDIALDTETGKWIKI